MTWTGRITPPHPPVPRAIGSPPGTEATSARVPGRCVGTVELPDAGVGALILKCIAEA